MRVYSDRGKISELNKPKEEEPELRPWEKRLKKLVDYAMVYKDLGIMKTLGFIYADTSGKAALPISIHQIKEKVKNIYSQSNSSQIDDLKCQLDRCFIEPEMRKEAKDILHKEAQKIGFRKIANEKRSLIKRVN
jgi:hypothetical protein